MCLCKYNVQYTLGDQQTCSCHLPCHLIFYMALKKRQFWFSYYRFFYFMIPAYHACMLSKAIFMSVEFSLCFSRGHCLEWWSLVFQWLHLLSAECLGSTSFMALPSPWDAGTWAFTFRFCHFRPMDGLTTFVPGRLPGWWMSTMERSWKRQSLCHNHSFTRASLKL